MLLTYVAMLHDSVIFINLIVFVEQLFAVVGVFVCVCPAAFL